jgi:hypothetical protein
MWSKIFRRMIVGWLAALAFWSTGSSAVAEELTIVFTGVKATSTSSCEVTTEINNNTGNHVDQISLHADFFTIDLKDLRAYQGYIISVKANRKCSDFVAAVSEARKLSRLIDRCSMEGLREGDCLKAVTIDSNLSAKEAMQTDAVAAATARAAAAKEALEQQANDKAEAESRRHDYIQGILSCRQGLIVTTRLARVHGYDVEFRSLYNGAIVADVPTGTQFTIAGVALNGGCVVTYNGVQGYVEPYDLRDAAQLP